LRSLCGAVEVWPVRTNAGFLHRLLGTDAFREGDLDTGYIPRHVDALTRKPEADSLGEAVRMLIPRYVHDVPHGLRGFRLNADRRIRNRFLVDGEERELDVDVDTPFDYSWPLGWTSDGEAIVIFSGGEAYAVAPAFRKSSHAGAGETDGAIVSPMPGKIISLDVSQGAAVKKGQKLLTLEAMKMEHSLTAPFDGIVAELNAAVGAQVSEGTMLVRIEKGEGD
jgi:3-methylcrotonyl-CoA carboxylase alpha subunit